MAEEHHSTVAFDLEVSGHGSKVPLAIKLWDDEDFIKMINNNKTELLRLTEK